MHSAETLSILKSKRARRPELAGALDMYIAILEARAVIELPFTNYPFSADDIDACLARGEPLLRVDELTFDWDAVARLARTICAIAARYRPEAADAFAELAREFESPARTKELARAFLAPETIELPLTNYQLLAFVLTHALHPWLSAPARALQSSVRADAWQRGNCPICGGEPDFAALTQEGGAWRLLCARCDAEWTCPRAHCPFCGAEPIAYFPSQDGAYRLYGCDRCKRYLKTIDLREFAREACLPAERVLTIGMDVAALEAGYQSA
ncbi:MAG: formate dehydrogenase accessory protein FdhE [Chloroflexi bacterium]|nr:formate dehydrogenase accessory protein FdhE [Chloroflexota bacterium]